MRRAFRFAAPLLFFLWAMLLHDPAHADVSPREAFGVWESSYLVARVVVYVEEEKRLGPDSYELKGIVYFYGPGGRVTYHVRGRAENGAFEARHHNGMRFVGRLVSPTQADCTAHLPDGRVYTAKAWRKSGVKTGLGAGS